MASSASAQIRLLGTSSSSRNVAFRQRSTLNSNRVSFGSLPPRSSSLTLSSCSSARTANGILSVAAAKGGNVSTSCYDALERLAIEAGKILAKEVANMFEEARAQLPEGVADDVERLVEEAANALAAGEKRSGDIAETENLAAASGNGASYDELLERSETKAGKVLLVKDLTNTLEEEITPQKMTERVMAEEAAKWWAVCEIKEKIVADEAEEAAKEFAERKKRVADEAEEAAKEFAERKKRVADEAERVMSEEAAARKMREKRFSDELERVMAEEEAAKTFAERKMTERVMAEEAAKWLDAREIKEKRVADEAEEAAKMFAERKKRVADEAERVMSEEAAARKIREKRFADEFERVMAEEAAARKIKEKRVADEAEEAAKKFAERKMKEKRVAEEFERVIAEERNIKEKSSGDTYETEKHAPPSGVEELFGLMNRYITSL